MRSLSLMLILTGCLVAGRAAADPSQDVLAANRGVREALVARDAAALEKLLAKDVVFTHASGFVQDRSAVLASLDSDALVYLGFEDREAHASLYGDTGVVTGLVLLNLSASGDKLDLLLRYTAVLHRLDGRWQLVAYQSTRAPAAK